MSQKIIDILNEAIQSEIGAIMQYMAGHYRMPKDKHPVIREMLERISVEEMKHAESFSKRVVALGGREAITPDIVHFSNDLVEIMDLNEKAEDGAIEMYQKHIMVCEQENDLETKAIYEDVLKDEMRHKKIFATFKKLLESNQEGI
ncbi:ferritin-like domain-containing protein [Desulfurella sp.]|uniref:ferritin-like domain-containing protein n=1 Tax=Desulfurella sp. TaxID=1962857 RepID=UPI0025B99D9D|nr:ferritin-like domain-containing protein [Desulfurella sp.]